MVNSGIPESMGFFSVSKEDFSPLERKIYALVLERWPTSALEVAEHFEGTIESRENRKKLSTKYAYYLKKLVEKRLLFSKRFGNSLIVWPVRVERYRTVHSILSGDEW